MTKIEPVGSTAEAFRENRTLARELEKQMESGKQPQRVAYPPLGAKHIGDGFCDGRYIQYYYQKARAEYLQIPPAEKKR